MRHPLFYKIIYFKYYVFDELSLKLKKKIKNNKKGNVTRN